MASFFGDHAIAPALRRGPLALLLVLPLLAPVAAAATVSYSFRATDAGFVVAGEEGTDPVLRVPPGSHVVLSFRNDASTPQNLHIGPPIDQETPCCQRPGETASLAFDIAPDSSGRIEYGSSVRGNATRSYFEIGEVPPRVRFLAPADGASVGSDVSARVSVVGTPNVTLRYALDRVNVTGVTKLTDFTFTNLTSGHHLLHVELVDANGAFLVPRVFDERIVFRGRDALLTPETNTSTPTASTPATPSRTPAPGFALLVGVVVAAALVARRRSH